MNKFLMLIRITSFQRVERVPRIYILSDITENATFHSIMWGLPGLRLHGFVDVIKQPHGDKTCLRIYAASEEPDSLMHLRRLI